jgi:hypothetical protein
MAKKGSITPGSGQDITTYSVAQLQDRACLRREEGNENGAQQFDRELARRAQLWDDLEEGLT